MFSAKSYLVYNGSTSYGRSSKRKLISERANNLK